MDTVEQFEVPMGGEGVVCAVETPEILGEVLSEREVLELGLNLGYSPEREQDDGEKPGNGRALGVDDRSLGSLEEGRGNQERLEEDACERESSGNSEEDRQPLGEAGGSEGILEDLRRCSAKTKKGLEIHPADGESRVPRDEVTQRVSEDEGDDLNSVEASDESRNCGDAKEARIHPKDDGEVRRTSPGPNVEMDLMRDCIPVVQEVSSRSQESVVIDLEVKGVTNTCVDLASGTASGKPAVEGSADGEIGLGVVECGGVPEEIRVEKKDLRCDRKDSMNVEEAESLKGDQRNCIVSREGAEGGMISRRTGGVPEQHVELGEDSVQSGRSCGISREDGVDQIRDESEMSKGNEFPEEKADMDCGNGGAETIQLESTDWKTTELIDDEVESCLLKLVESVSDSRLYLKRNADEIEDSGTSRCGVTKKSKRSKLGAALPSLETFRPVDLVEDHPSDCTGSGIGIARTILRCVGNEVDMGLPNESVETAELKPGPGDGVANDCDIGESKIRDVTPDSGQSEESPPRNSSNEKSATARRRVSFHRVRIYFFEREQGFASVPTEGGSTLGMGLQHKDTRDYSIDEHEQMRLNRLRQPSYFSQTGPDSSSVQPLTLRRRRQLLRQSGIQYIESIEKTELEMIRLSREQCGCTCENECQPDICLCSSLEIECQVDGDGYPCGCTVEKCANLYGRREFNKDIVKQHNQDTRRRVNERLETPTDELEEAAQSEDSGNPDSAQSPPEPLDHSPVDVDTVEGDWTKHDWRNKYPPADVSSDTVFIVLQP